jgi:hypothetical protein
MIAAAIALAGNSAELYLQCPQTTKSDLGFERRAMSGVRF